MTFRVLLFFVTVLISCPPQASIPLQQSAKPLNILILNSWHLGMPWQTSFEIGLKSVLNQSPNKPNIFIEYLDAGRFSGIDFQQSLSSHLIKKYRNTNLDIVISESRPAAALLFNNPNSFPGARKIYVQPGFNEEDIARLDSNRDRVIPVDVDFEGAIRESLKMVSPQHIYLVADTSTPSRLKRLKDFKQALDGFREGFEVHELINLPMQQLINKTSKLPDKSVIFYLLIFKDGEGEKYIPYTALKLIADHANAPIFSHWDTLMGSGMLGGYLLSGERVGNIAAQVIINPNFSIMDNAGIKPHGLYFDWAQVVKWRLEKKINAEAFLINYSPGVIEKYFWFFVSLAGLIGLLIIISLRLVIMNKKKQKALVEIWVEQNLLSEQAEELKLANEKLETLSLSDELTQLSNRRHFDELLELEYMRLRRAGIRMSLLMIDIDHFKNYNDHYGHLSGDRCLQEVAGAIRRVFNRTTDFPARYGGEEFAVILTNTDVIGSAALAEELRAVIYNLNFPHIASPINSRITVSIGAVTVDNSSIECPEQIIRLADKLLYKAKQSGRNRVEVQDYSQ